jgi:hypothetical protein
MLGIALLVRFSCNLYFGGYAVISCWRRSLLELFSYDFDDSQTLLSVMVEQGAMDSPKVESSRQPALFFSSHGNRTHLNVLGS